MKDPYVVLREKEGQAARLRNEIAALLTIIPLLSDNSCAGVCAATVLECSQEKPDPADISMTDLKRYYPFIRHLKTYASESDCCE